jgi:hypothetical protein
MPSDEESISAMRDESYSFIWQPKVLMNTFFGEFMFRQAEHASKNAASHWSVWGCRSNFAK